MPLPWSGTRWSGSTPRSGSRRSSPRVCGPSRPAPHVPPRSCASTPGAAPTEVLDPGIVAPVNGDTGEDPASTPVERGWVLVGGAIASGVSLAAGVLLARRRSRGDHHWERLA